MGRTTSAITYGAVVQFVACAGLTNAESRDAAVRDAQIDAAIDASGPACPPGSSEWGCVMIGGSCDCEPGMTCCYHEFCKPDASVHLIQASDYDQACQTDSDCVAVWGFGNACGACDCPRAAINKSSEPRYSADLGKIPMAACFCLPSANGPCCVGGACQLSDDLCPGTPVIRPPGEAAADTGTDAAADASAE